MTTFFTDPKCTIETERLILRPPQASDFSALEEMAKDEETMRFIGGVSEPAMTWRTHAMLTGHWALRGYGFFSVIERESGNWMGRVGPWNPHLWPEPEVGWTITRPYWNQGFAREAAMASINWTFEHLGWEQVTHMIDPANTPSQALARSLGSKPLREIDELPGFGKMKIVIWGQTRKQWQENFGDT